MGRDQDEVVHIVASAVPNPEPNIFSHDDDDIPEAERRMMGLPVGLTTGRVNARRVSGGDVGGLHS